MVKRILAWCFDVVAQRRADKMAAKSAGYMWRRLEERVEKLEELRDDELRLQANMRHVPYYGDIASVHELFKD